MWHCPTFKLGMGTQWGHWGDSGLFFFFLDLVNKFFNFNMDSFVASKSVKMAELNARYRRAHC